MLDRVDARWHVLRHLGRMPIRPGAFDPRAPRAAIESAWTFAGKRWRLSALCAALIASASSVVAVTQTPPPVLTPAAWEPTGPRTTWNGISFIVPTGMKGVDRGELYDMAGPGIKGGGPGQCSIIILRDVAAAPDLGKQAHDLLAQILAGLGQRATYIRGQPDFRVGRSADGWDWIELNGLVGNGRARIMLIARGPTVMPIAAVASQGNGCVGLLGETTPNSNTITWLWLFHSLTVAGSTPSTHLRGQVIGRWELLSASTGRAGAQGGSSQGETYAANGRYASTSVVLGDVGSNSLTRGLSGDGRHVIEGNRLTIVPDRGAPQTRLVRIVEDREATVPPQSTVKLCQINVDVGGASERCLTRSVP